MSEELKQVKCNVLFIGKSNVGKINIISRFINNTFKPTKSTSIIGVEVFTKTLMMKDENQLIKFNICDIAGRERFSSIPKAYYEK